MEKKLIVQETSDVDESTGITHTEATKAGDEPKIILAEPSAPGIPGPPPPPPPPGMGPPVNILNSMH